MCMELEYDIYKLTSLGYVDIDSEERNNSNRNETSYMGGGGAYLNQKFFT